MKTNPNRNDLQKSLALVSAARADCEMITSLLDVWSKRQPFTLDSHCADEPRNYFSQAQDDLAQAASAFDAVVMTAGSR